LSRQLAKNGLDPLSQALVLCTLPGTTYRRLLPLGRFYYRKCLLIYLDRGKSRRILANRDAGIESAAEEVQRRAIQGTDYERSCNAVQSLANQAAYIYGAASAQTVKIGDSIGKTDSVFTDFS
jgi:hypothetical protein